MSSLHRSLAAAMAFVASLIIAGCGGGGAGAQGSGGGSTGGVVEPASVQVRSSEPTISSNGDTPVTITVFVKDSANRAMANQQVSMALIDPVGAAGGLLKDIVAKTDASGTASATLVVTDPTNRTVTVTAQSGTASGSIEVPVIGTTLALTGPSSVVLNAVTDYVVALRDSDGAALSGRAVSVASQAGNTLSAATVTTNTAGQARFSLTATKSGADRVTVSALGATAGADVSVASSQLVFAAPAAGQELEVTSAARPRTHQVSVEWRSGGQPVAGRRVDFGATRGTITASAVTNAAGVATAQIESPTAGSSTITARTDDGTLVGTQRAEFVSVVPSKIALQSSPANVGVNPSGSTANSSQLIAVVRDAADNPVKGQLVSFSAFTDPSNGRIEPAVATTDASGVATVAFYPGANSTGNGQIEIRSAIPGSTVPFASTRLTASQQELIVRIGTGNALEVPDIVNYVMPWDAVVTDASGNPVANAAVQASLVGIAFYKGGYYPAGDYWAAGGETETLPRYKCVSEDVNGNLRLDAGEDTNGNGELTPGNVAAAQVVATNARTDSTGFARINVKYPKEYGNWAQVRLVVTITTIAGTEGSATRTIDLPVVRDDLKITQTPPGGLVSAFGLRGDCTSTN